eukprot:CAMPEP_0175064192 /NCGR_PEP_ID=MMETSP0052_2-20121109/15183_1 /TAXON_ID=51329 ORGANISM="Polytomella parva, Strain SAG 63-3" /NCGR_SAMPLE_ID=MMETSP0052_2 /ASSEMBLY_ACC=CAM_ASM_000194 /LENGTH=397 /DNA_ID=CAMNT_0016330489 /DNA_START=270 /DNA_END=1463 /DNA_ORIENTATION=+
MTELEDSGKLTPIMHDEGVTYVYIQVSNIYVLGVTRTNANAASCVAFLHRFVNVLKEYFQEVEEESLRDNFVILYELLDEVMDNGLPQFTEACILGQYIKTDAYKLDLSSSKPPPALTQAVSWRVDGIKHKKNEVFLDVVESVNLLVNDSGQIIQSEVTGVLKMRTFLSGMPECKLGLNDRVLFEIQGRAGKQKTVELEDTKFHQCVRLARFDTDRTISFVPPDGAFDLMSYRISQNIKPLIAVECAMKRLGRSVVEYHVVARTLFKERSSANNVEIQIPVPNDAITPGGKASTGTVSYAPERSALLWNIKNFPGGGKEYTLRCRFTLPSVAAEEERKGKLPPIKVKFDIPFFTVSGIQVRYLKVIEKTGYQALPWVRYITTAGNYEVRIGSGDSGR